MCGIAGFIDFKHNSSLKYLQQCTDVLTHRGPDGGGYEFLEEGNAQIALGHRRLSIIDLSAAAKQPMWYKDYCIIFNGEMYNYAQVKETLLQAGHQFTTHSDTEVILHAWEQWGKEMLHRFIGMFSMVIYDRQTQKLFACRDRAGVKPFIYYFYQDLFLFGSELKALMQHPGFKKDLDVNAISAYLQFGYVPTPHCIFKHTKKLPPGHYLEFDVNTRTAKTSCYWSIYNAYNQPLVKISYEDAVEETEKILTTAFQYRMVSDVPVGVFLSGGYDSSCVTALLQKNSTEKIKTFTIGFADAGLDEAPVAKQIAALLGTDHTEHYCTEKEALDIVPKLPFFYDEPFADSSAIPTCLVSREARKSVTVALSADAGDEVFAGYNRYEQVIKYGKRLQKLPAFARKATASLMDAVPANAIPVLNKKYLFHSRYEKVKSFLKNSSQENLMLGMVKQMSDAEAAGLFTRNVFALPNAFSSNELMPEYFDLLHYMMAIDYQTYLPDDILQKVDKATMSASLEGREPFLDQHIIEWVAKLPSGFKYRNGEKKALLKSIVHKYLPKELMDRPKRGFAIPLAKWLQKDLKPLVEEYLDPAFLHRQDIFKASEIIKIKDSFYRGKLEKAEKLWHILMFQMWYKQWIEQN